MHPTIPRKTLIIRVSSWYGLNLGSLWRVRLMDGGVWIRQTFSMIQGWRLNQNLLLIVKGMMPCCMYGSTVIHTPFNTTLRMKDLTQVVHQSVNRSHNTSVLFIPNAEKCNVKASDQEHDAQTKTPFPMMLKECQRCDAFFDTVLPKCNSILKRRKYVVPLGTECISRQGCRNKVLTKQACPVVRYLPKESLDAEGKFMSIHHDFDIDLTIRIPYRPICCPPSGA